MRAARAVEAEDVVPGAGRHLGGGARRQLEMGNVVDRGVDAVLLAPVADEAVEPFVVLGHEMAPLQDLERLGVGERRRHEGRGDEWRQARRAGGDTALLDESPPVDARFVGLSSLTHICLHYGVGWSSGRHLAAADRHESAGMSARTPYARADYAAATQKSAP